MRKRVSGVIFIFLYAVLLFSGCMRIVATDSVSDYLKTDVPLSYSEFRLFPREIPEGMESTYRSVSKSSVFYDDVYFLLECSYDEEQFTNEINRLNGSGAEYSEDIFLCPAYIMICSGKFYEYALIDSDNSSIVYVAGQIADWTMFDDFPQGYAPLKTENVDICCYED